MRLSPALRTFTLEQVCRNWDHNSHRSVHVWAEFDAHLDGLMLPALQRVHVRLHDGTHGVCYSFECHGHECDCRKCRRDRVLLCDCHDHKLPTDDRWKCQAEEIMPLLRGRGILKVEVVKRQLTF